MSHIKISTTVKLLLLLLGVNAANANEITLESLNLGRVKDSEQKILENFSGYYSGSAQLDANGWSVLAPSKDSRLVYVSYSSGSDKTGKVYKRSEITEPGSPGTISEFKTIQSALKYIRPGYPDYLLLKRGDSWLMEKSIVLKGGRSPSERMVLMAYGDQNERPVIKSTTIAIKVFGSASSIAITGLHLYAHNRDPNSASFSGWGSVPNSMGIKVFKSNTPAAKSILIENCVINFYNAGITISGKANYQDIVVRRNILTNSYSENTHSSGVFSLNASILVEENLFDHNGWFKQKESLEPTKKYGQATKFNHHTYFSSSRNSIIRNNVFLRSASAHNKWSSNSRGNIDSINAKNLIVRDNFYYAGEIGISAGGNKDRDSGPRWHNLLFIDNVMLGIGKNQPTNRNLGWYITIDDWDTGVVCGNHLLDNQNKNVTNLLGISVTGHSSDIVISHNTISGLVTNRPLQGAISTSRGPVKNLSIAFNSIELHNSRMQAISIESNVNIKLGNNNYFTGAPANNWFKLGKKSLGFDAWTNLVSDQNSQVSDAGSSRLTKDFGTYLSSLGISSVDEFVAKATKISRKNSPDAFSSSTINDYFRQQFGNQKCPTSM